MNYSCSHYWLLLSDRHSRTFAGMVSPAVFSDESCWPVNGKIMALAERYFKMGLDYLLAKRLDGSMEEGLRSDWGVRTTKG